MRILVIGLIGSGNLGDDLISSLLVNEYILKKWSGAEIGLIYGQQGNPFGYSATAKITFLATPRMSEPRSYFVRRRELKRFVKKCDLILIGGGGLFQDSHFLFTVHNWMRHSLIFSKKDCETWIIGAGFGPLNHSLTGWYLKETLSRASVIQVRDSHSKKLVEALGHEAVLNCDVVAGSSLLQTPFLHANRGSGVRALGCAIRPWKGLSLPRLVRLIATSCECFKLDEVSLFVFEHTRFGNDYERSFNMVLADKLRQAGVRTRTFCYNVDPLKAFVAAFSSVEYAIGMRFHANILWQKLGVKVLPLSYAPKVRSLYEENGGVSIDVADMPIEDVQLLYQSVDMTRDYFLPDPLVSNVRRTKARQIVIAYAFEACSLSLAVARSLTIRGTWIWSRLKQAGRRQCG